MLYFCLLLFSFLYYGETASHADPLQGLGVGDVGVTTMGAIENIRVTFADLEEFFPVYSRLKDAPQFKGKDEELGWICTNYQKLIGNTEEKETNIVKVSKDKTTGEFEVSKKSMTADEIADMMRIIHDKLKKLFDGRNSKMSMEKCIYILMRAKKFKAVWEESIQIAKLNWADTLSFARKEIVTGRISIADPEVLISDKDITPWTNGKEYGFFQGSIFSQWSDGALTFLGTEYKAAEAWMMTSKARLFEPDNAVLIDATIKGTPNTVKQLGRLVQNFDDGVWTEYRSAIVFFGNWLKFTQNRNAFNIITNPELKNLQLVEAAYYDDIWGNKLFCNLKPNWPNYLDITLLTREQYWVNGRNKNKPALNLLGKAVTEVKSEIYNFQQRAQRDTLDDTFQFLQAPTFNSIQEEYQFYDKQFDGSQYQEYWIKIKQIFNGQVKLPTPSPSYSPTQQLKDALNGKRRLF